MKLTEVQRGVVVAIVLGDMGMASGWDDSEHPSEEQMQRGNKLANWLETLYDRQPESPEFYEAALLVGEAAMNDKLEVTE